MGHVGGTNAVGEVQDAGAVGGKADAGSAGYAAEAVGHQRRPLLVANADEFQVVSVVQRIEYVEEGGADYPENVGNTFLSEQFNDGFAGFSRVGHLRHLLGRSTCSLTYQAALTLGGQVRVLP